MCKRPHGKRKYQRTDNTKVEIKRGNLLKKKMKSQGERNFKCFQKQYWLLCIYQQTKRLHRNVLYYIIKFIHYAKSSLIWVFSISFLVPYAPLWMFGDPSGTVCGDVCFLVYRSWNDRDVSMAGMYDCVRVYEFYNVMVILGCWFIMFIFFK